MFGSGSFKTEIKPHVSEISDNKHPYPSEEQKKQLAQDTGLTILQVNNWQDRTAQMVNQWVALLWTDRRTWESDHLVLWVVWGWGWVWRDSGTTCSTNTTTLQPEDPPSVPGNHRLSRSADLFGRREAGPHASSPVLPSAPPPLWASTWPDKETPDSRRYSIATGGALKTQQLKHKNNEMWRHMEILEGIKNSCVS
ncbi:putative homeobox protein [Collichthys lucidus]|uniref:Putative homeobox protein n=1 Tax=Collichthys lucidus TaxID=240159 RepID=A0A4U5U4M2_COLLU|nr:putative homeobox protein [Collichthys lucidus]